MSIVTKNFRIGPSIEVFFLSEDKVELKMSSSPFKVSFVKKIKNEEAILAWLESYGQKKPTPVDFLPRQVLPIFSENVLDALKKIPFGKCLSYEKLAELAGSPKAVRAAGSACKKNPLPLFIPCHRVISKKQGDLGGFAFGLEVKKTLLLFEGSI
jgi:methylated-DNA-[protein]-cysteine S-methyltransferase